MSYIECKSQKVTERSKERQKERQIERKIERKIDRKKERKKDRKKERQKDRKKKIERKIERNIQRKIGRMIERKLDREEERKIERKKLICFMNNCIKTRCITCQERSRFTCCRRQPTPTSSIHSLPSALAASSRSSCRCHDSGAGEIGNRCCARQYLGAKAPLRRKKIFYFLRQSFKKLLFVSN